MIDPSKVASSQATKKPKAVGTMPPAVISRPIITSFSPPNPVEYLVLCSSLAPKYPVPCENIFIMFNWAKQQLANVAGTQEPIYGPEAIKSVAVETEKTPFTESKREDLKWQAMDSTSVETQTIYIFGENGYVALLQVIYSNVAGIRTTCQFNCKVFLPRPLQAHPLVFDTPQQP
ncbi:hypothetical protein CEP52_016312 [Fusarium oligoseptatum]|uniref:Svf1-like N-terminal domain-containing protein n=1 Tax=Fusarium oligoseptatum TaxID=2604345 RepID=A0A428S4Q9_9HYPO|nr:hypothetical protein CEP52_016312 [Fusarium oligoseptatum]